MRICSLVKSGAAWVQRLAVHLMGWSGLFHEGPWRRSIAMAGLGGAISLALLLLRGVLRIPDTVAETLFIMVHPMHVFVAAATMVRLLTRNGRFRSLPATAISYPIAIAIVTITDSLLPYVAEWLLALPSRHVHIGFAEFWWIVHPLAIAGIASGLAVPRLRLRPSLVLAASILPPLFDMMMAMWKPLDPVADITIAVFAGLCVWIYLLGTAAAAAAITRGSSAISKLKATLVPYLEATEGETDIDPTGKRWYSRHQPCQNRKRTGSSSSRRR